MVYQSIIETGLKEVTKLAHPWHLTVNNPGATIFFSSDGASHEDLPEHTSLSLRTSGNYEYAPVTIPYVGMIVISFSAPGRLQEERNGVCYLNFSNGQFLREGSEVWVPGSWFQKVVRPQMKMPL